MHLGLEKPCPPCRCALRSFSTNRDLTNANVLVTKNGAALDVSRIDDKMTRIDTLVWDMMTDMGELRAAGWAGRGIVYVWHASQPSIAWYPDNNNLMITPTTALTARRLSSPDILYSNFGDPLARPFVAYYQPITDIRYGVEIVDAGSSQVIASYNVTVFGVDGLAWSQLANLGRRPSPKFWGPTPYADAAAAVVAEARKGMSRNSALPSWATEGVATSLGALPGSAEGVPGPESASPMFTQAPTMPAQWGQ
jgi:hypothetical protein